MYRYRYERGTSQEFDPKSSYRSKPLEKLKNIGQLKKIVAIRYLAKRTSIFNGEKTSYFTTLERIRVIGELGSVRYSGVCWGYGGSGPHATYNILKACNVPDGLAKHYAFHFRRKSACGIDWSINFIP